MRTVTNNYKTVAKSEAKEIAVSITDGTTTITSSDDIYSFKILSNGGLFKTLLRQAEVQYFGTHDFLDKYLNIKFGFMVNGSPEYIDYGYFKVVEVEESKGSGTRKIKLYDRMYEALKLYETVGTYPQEVGELVDAICTELGWNLESDTFFNSDLEIGNEVFLNQNLTYRDVLNYIAEVTGTTILFNEDDKLELRKVDTSVSLETLTTADLNTFILEPKWGELNSLVLAREPQEDNIVEQDSQSIIDNGLWEIRFINNLILDSDRQNLITDLFNEIKGLEYNPLEAKTVGLGYIEVGDIITLKDKDNNEYKVFITDVELDVTGGLRETIKGRSPLQSSTNYKTAGIIGKKITNTEIIVNKQEGEIQLINQKMETVATIPRQSTEPDNPELNDLWLNTVDNVIYIYNGINWQPTALRLSDLVDYYTKGETNAEITMATDSIQLSVQEIDSKVAENEGRLDGDNVRIEELQSSLASLELRADGLELGVESIGGSNLLKNSAGLKGRIDEWQVFDEEGDLVDVNNDGEAILTSDTEENTESGGGIRIEEQYIVQSVPTILGNPYTFYCRFKKLLDIDLTITGVTGGLKITSGDYVDEEWAVYKYTFTANSDMTEIKISNVSSGAGAYAILSDMVLKLGFVSGWIQAPNEVYGKNYRFDKDGFNVTSLTDEFKAVLDNVKLGIYDTSAGIDKIMALFSKDEGLVTKLVAQDEFTLQRYQNSERATRFIPTSKGCMITVNE